MMAEADERNRVLVVGAQGVGKSYLIDRIIREPAQHATVPEIKLQAVVWNLDTKYYNAELEIIEILAHEYDFDEHTVEQKCQALAETCQALVLVYNAHKAESFAALRHWAAFVDHFQPSVLLCVGNSPVNMDHQPSLERTAQDWALEAGLEHVTVPFSDSSAQEAAAQARGMLGEETLGVERVLEALASNMWDSMQMKARPQLGRSRSDSEDSSTATPQATDVTTETPTPTVFGPELPPDLKARREEEKRKAQEAERKAFGNFAQLAMAEPRDEEMDQFTRIFQKMQATREMAPGLPDHERRKRAEQAIMDAVTSLGIEMDDGPDSP